MWNTLIRNEITPNQFYLMYAIKEQETTPFINISLELKILKRKGWITEDGKLSTKANRIVSQIDGYFKRAKKKTDLDIMGDSYNEMINKYSNLWPKMKLPSGKAARSATGNIEPAFRWFFENYKYNWEKIHKATALYLDEKEADGWNYTRNSQYFIRKQNNDKSWSSDLADYCQLIDDGGDAPKENHFKEKIY